ncbi:MAG: glutaredoxin family protein [Mycobacteriales bacterium]
MTGAAAARPAARVSVLSTRGCHLCEQAAAVVARIATEMGVTWEYLDITDDPALMADYAEQVPVIMVDGSPLDYWRVDEARLRSALSG